MTAMCPKVYLWLALLLALAGCGRPINLDGTWVGYRKLASAEGADPSMVRTLSKVEVKIGGNGKFSLYAGQVPVSGTVRYTSEKAYLDVREIMGQGLSRQPQDVQERYGTIELTPQPDGTVLYHDPKVAEDPVVLKKQGKPTQ
jgi:hypothetical protein